MKKVLWLGIVIVTLLVATAVPAAAAGGKNQNWWRGSSFSLVGQVTAANSGSISVAVQTGNRLVKKYIGTDLTVATTADTLFLRYGDAKCEVITWEDIDAGAYASISGIVIRSEAGEETFVAQRVTIDVPLHTQS